MDAPLALDGVRVLEVGGGIPASYGARILGDLGADVIKVEPPTGDKVRPYGPMLEGAAGQAHSALFEYLNWNKRSVVLDLAQLEGRAALRSLLQDADILVMGLRPGVLTRWRLSIDVLRAWHPALVVVSVSDFGLDGPYAEWQGSDLIIQAMSGIMSFSGTAEGEPLKQGLRQSYYCAGLNVAYTAEAAYYTRLGSGAGVHVDISVLEVVTSELVRNLPLYVFGGAIQGREASAGGNPLRGEPLACGDGYVTLQTNPMTKLAQFARLLDEPGLADARFETQGGRNLHGEEIRSLLQRALANRRGRDVFVQGAREGLLVGFVQTAKQLLECPHLEARGAWHRVDSGGRTWKFPRGLGGLSTTPSRVSRPAPNLGVASAEPTTWAASTSRQAPAHVAATGSAREGAPLEGLRVLDLSTVYAVPYMGGLLRDLGAEVIKIEAPDRLDQTRSGTLATEVNAAARPDYWNQSGSFHIFHRGKRSIGLNLRTEAGRSVLRDLVGISDILLENFTPRVMPGWGTSYAQLAELNPRLIMLSNTGYGSSGPWSSFKAQGTTLEATMGLSTYSGYQDGPPAKIGQSYPDFLACWTGLTLIMAALIHRRRSGRGQWIDLGMYQLGPTVIPEALLAVQAGECELARAGNRDLDAFVSGLFAAPGTEQWLAVSICDDAALARLSHLIPGLAEGLPTTVGDRTAALCALEETLRRWSAARPLAESVRLLQGAGIAAGPVNDARAVLRDPQLRARAFFEDADFGPPVGSRPLIGRPYRWRGNGEVRVRGRGPMFAEDNDYVLRDLLGYSGERIGALRQERVIVDVPVSPPPVTPMDVDALLRSGFLREVDRGFEAVVGGPTTYPSPPAARNGGSADA